MLSGLYVDVALLSQLMMTCDKNEYHYKDFQQSPIGLQHPRSTILCHKIFVEIPTVGFV